MNAKDVVNGISNLIDNRVRAAFCANHHFMEELEQLDGLIRAQERLLIDRIESLMKVNMIPSLNSQPVPVYPAKGNWEQVDRVKLPYVCDCCRKHISPAAFHMPDDYWDREMNPRLVEVGGMTYYGCSTECARILFDIHHRYALAEGK